MSRLILVSNRLPVHVDASGQLARSGGGLTSAMQGLPKDLEQIWVGWPGQLDSTHDRDELSRRLWNEQRSRAVFLDQQVYEGYYEGYANATLWPVLHYASARAVFDPDWFRAYRAANQAFAEALRDQCKPGDRVWIHDYHLMLLPAMLREQRSDLSIGWFLHVPFPSHELFRIIPDREALLTGILGSDVIGFHTFSYLRHFRSALLRELDQESEPGTTHVGDREVRMGVYPIGHDREGFEQATRTEEYRHELERLNVEFEGQKLVLNVGRLDYSKGIPQMLQAIDLFLTRNPERGKDTTFLIIAVPSRQKVGAYQELTDRVQLTISEINGKHSTFSRQPIHFFRRNVDRTKLAALYARADVGLVTPLVDGMNLVAKEFVACKDAPGARPGSLVLSETAGAAQELGGALLVNPYDTDGMAHTILQALDRPTTEVVWHLQPMKSRVLRRDAAAWAKAFLDDLSAGSRCKRDPTLRVDAHLNQRLTEADKLALFLDYDGTLHHFVERPEDAVPGDELRTMLKDLSSLPGVELAILSGRPDAFLQQHFGDLPLTLVGEHGYRWKLWNGEDAESTWELFNPRTDTSWKPVVRELLDLASDLTPGTHVEEKASALVWHYRSADPEFGAWKASELIGELMEIVSNLPVEVHHGKKIVEVASQQVSKGAALDQLMRLWSPDRALAIGDDRTDETMFAMHDNYEELETVKVGPGATAARMRVNTIGSVYALLFDLLDSRRRLIDAGSSKQLS